MNAQYERWEQMQSETLFAGLDESTIATSARIAEEDSFLLTWSFELDAAVSVSDTIQVREQD
jgi:hypothetical protein